MEHEPTLYVEHGEIAHAAGDAELFQKHLGLDAAHLISDTRLAHEFSEQVDPEKTQLGFALQLEAVV